MLSRIRICFTRRLPFWPRQINFVPEPERPLRLREHVAYPIGTSTWATKKSSRIRREISDGSAASKNRDSASIKLAQASSIDTGWLAMSSLGHGATNPSSSRSIIAVIRRIWFMSS